MSLSGLQSSWNPSSGAGGGAGGGVTSIATADENGLVGDVNVFSGTGAFLTVSQSNPGNAIIISNNGVLEMNSQPATGYATASGIEINGTASGDAGYLKGVITLRNTGVVSLTPGDGITVDAGHDNGDDSWSGDVTIRNTGVTGILAGASTLTATVTLGAGQGTQVTSPTSSRVEYSTAYLLPVNTGGTNFASGALVVNNATGGSGATDLTGFIVPQNCGLMLTLSTTAPNTGVFLLPKNIAMATGIIPGWWCLIKAVGGAGSSLVNQAGSGSSQPNGSSATLALNGIYVLTVCSIAGGAGGETYYALY